MANQNLSQFGEKLFVADADHTFIWDTAASISKRVSRNSWLNSGTLTSDAPVTISQTWNAGSNVMTALKVVATDTASGATSNLLELWAGNAATLKIRIDKNGDFYGRSLLVSGNVALTGSGSYYTGYLNGLYIDHNAFIANQGAYIGFSAVNNAASNGADVKLVRDGAANTLALRNGAAAQTFNVYGTSSASNANYARLALTCGLDGNATISTQALGTGTAGVLAFSPGNSERMRITTAGNVGIGTTSPTFKLCVQGDTECRGKLYVTQSSPTTALVFDSTVGGVHRIYAEATQNIALQSGGAIGNVGIGTSAPTSKLQVSAGDVEVDTIAKGVILKSPDGTRYRVTVANGGTLSVAAV